MLQENKFKRGKECYKAHQSSPRVDCEYDKLDDEEKENNSDMDNNSVVLRTESDKDCPESTVSQETSPAVQNHSRFNKTAIVDFSKAEGVICFNSDYFAIEQHVLAEKSLSSEEHSIIRKHDNGGKEGTLACQHKEVFSNSRKTGLTGSINRSDWSIKIVGSHQEKHDIIRIKVPCLSNIFDKVCCTSKLFNSQSDHMIFI